MYARRLITHPFLIGQGWRERLWQESPSTASFEVVGRLFVSLWGLEWWANNEPAGLGLPSSSACNQLLISPISRPVPVAACRAPR